MTCKSWKSCVFWKGKKLILSAEHYTVVQKQASRGFVRGECANGKFIKKPLKIRSKSVPKSIINRYKFHTRKSDARMMEKGAKMEPRGDRKWWKIRKMTCQKWGLDLVSPKNRNESRHDQRLATKGWIFGRSGGKGGKTRVHSGWLHP